MTVDEVNVLNGNGLVNGGHAINPGFVGKINKANGVNSRILHIPDLFSGILSGDPVENPVSSSYVFSPFLLLRLFYLETSRC